MRYRSLARAVVAGDAEHAKSGHGPNGSVHKPTESSSGDANAEATIALGSTGREREYRAARRTEPFVATVLCVLRRWQGHGGRRSRRGHP